MDLKKNNHSILVIDDSMVERTNLTSIVEASGYRSLSASSGEEGVETAKSMKPGIIFLDIMMSGMDGFKTCRILRNDDQTKDIPVVMISSKKNRADKVWAAEQGAVAYIIKPYKPEDIISTIEQFSA